VWLCSTDEYIFVLFFSKSPPLKRLVGSYEDQDFKIIKDTVTKFGDNLICIIDNLCRGVW